MEGLHHPPYDNHSSNNNPSYMLQIFSHFERLKCDEIVAVVSTHSLTQSNFDLLLEKVHVAVADHVFMLRCISTMMWPLLQIPSGCLAMLAEI